MIFRYAHRIRWLEPAGQTIVLVALGFQIFGANPAVQASNQATMMYIQALLEQHTLPEHPERAQSGIAVDRAKVVLQGMQARANEEKVKADFEKKWPTLIYIGLFVIGSAMIIIGKSASVAYSTKAPPPPPPAPEECLLPQPNAV